MNEKEEKKTRRKQRNSIDLVGYIKNILNQKMNFFFKTKNSPLLNVICNDESSDTLWQF